MTPATEPLKATPVLDRGPGFTGQVKDPAWVKVTGGTPAQRQAAVDLAVTAIARTAPEGDE